MCQNKCQEWLPFDPENVPEAKEGWCLLVRFGGLYKNLYVASFTLRNTRWYDFEDVSIMSYTFSNANPLTYKLVFLPQ